jgi:molybdopterin-guanine dinucleotide biosynthesis protein A
MSTGIYIGGIPNGMLGMNTNYAVVASADTTFTDADIIENLILS